MIGDVVKGGRFHHNEHDRVCNGRSDWSGTHKDIIPPSVQVLSSLRISSSPRTPTLGF
jgi:hypothetical protein